MLYIAGIESESVVDGEGWRYSIFTQGCKHKCKGCHNPQTWEMNKGTEISVDELFNNIKNAFEENILMDGVTITGGDPMYQPLEILELCKKLKSIDINIWMYTGFLYEEVVKDSDMSAILNYIDVLVDGPFIESLKSLELEYRGSKNQRLIDVPTTLKTGSISLFKLEGE